MKIKGKVIIVIYAIKFAFCIFDEHNHTMHLQLTAQNE